jgi:transposase
MIHGSRIRVRPGGDAKHMIALVNRVPSQDLKVVYGDKAYISRQNVQFISDLGADPAIEPKRGLSGKARGSPAYRRLIREYRPSPAGWKEQCQYGQRSQVETLFSMLKVRFTGSLTSRRNGQRRRELLIKVVLHNIERLNYLECAGR